MADTRLKAVATAESRRTLSAGTGESTAAGAVSGPRGHSGSGFPAVAAGCAQRLAGLAHPFFAHTFPPMHPTSVRAGTAPTSGAPASFSCCGPGSAVAGLSRRLGRCGWICAGRELHRPPGMCRWARIANPPPSKRAERGPVVRPVSRGHLRSPVLADRYGCAPCFDGAGDRNAGAAARPSGVSPSCTVACPDFPHQES